MFEASPTISEPYHQLKNEANGCRINNWQKILYPNFSYLLTTFLDRHFLSSVKICIQTSVHHITVLLKEKYKWEPEKLRRICKPIKLN
jgi:hypothetical protein